MKITEIRIEVVPPGASRARLLARFSVEFDHQLVVHGIRLIDTPDGWVLAMPKEDMRDKCHECGRRNSYEHRYCGTCGIYLHEDRRERHILYHKARHPERRVRFYQDWVHPVYNTFREYLEDACFDAYEQEQKQPGSVLSLFARRAQRGVS